MSPRPQVKTLKLYTRSKRDMRRLETMKADGWDVTSQQPMHNILGGHNGWITVVLTREKPAAPTLGDLLRRR